MTEIAVYLEGGGNTAQEKADLRRGFDDLFGEEKTSSRKKHGSLRFIPCGSRKEAHDAFVNALGTHPERVNALLVDSETAIPAVPDQETCDAAIRLAHLKREASANQQGDGWALTGALPERMHLMVQCMETWLVADPEALRAFYKQGFRPNDLPARVNLEEEAKSDVYSKLRRATQGTQKGEYRKIQHASELLQRIDPKKIAQRCPRFAILQNWLKDSIEN